MTAANPVTLPLSGYKARHVDFSVDGKVATLILNRPDKKNPLTFDSYAEVVDIFRAAARDKTVKAIVVTGAGGNFCSGGDVFEIIEPLTKMNTVELLDFTKMTGDVVKSMRACPQPIIATVRGAAAGGGLAMALASDIRIAGESVRMNAAFIRIGLSACDIGVSYFLPRLVGASVAAEFMLTGNFITADRALATGLVSRVVPDDQMEEAAAPLIEQMLTTSPMGLRLTKECLRMSIDAPSLEAAVAMEDRNQILCATSPDFGEGIKAFFEKRRPDYTKKKEQAA